jgi:hypothetical protein
MMAIHVLSTKKRNQGDYCKFLELGSVTVGCRTSPFSRRQEDAPLQLQVHRNAAVKHDNEMERISTSLILTKGPTYKKCSKVNVGRAIAKAVSSRFPNAAVRVQAWIRHWRRFFRVFPFPLAKHSNDCSTLINICYPGLVQQASNGLSNSGLGSNPTEERKVNVTQMYDAILIADSIIKDVSYII